jgi:hypothetical protein
LPKAIGKCGNGGAFEVAVQKQSICMCAEGSARSDKGDGEKGRLHVCFLQGCHLQADLANAAGEATRWAKAAQAERMKKLLAATPLRLCGLTFEMSGRHRLAARSGK